MFKRIEIQNFGLIEDFKCDLDNLGLVQIDGLYKDSGASRSNGAGKSFLFEALLWCLWGQTFRGSKGNKLIRKNAKRSKVQVIFDSNGKECVVVRALHRTDNDENTLRLWHDGDEVTLPRKIETQVIITDLLGIDYTTFTNSVLFGQRSIKRFASMTDAQIKDVFSQVLDFGQYEDALVRTKDKINALKFEQSKLEGELNTLTERLEKAEWDLQYAKDNDSKFENEKKEKLTELLQRIESHEEQIEISQANVKKVRKTNVKRETLRKELTALDTKKGQLLTKHRKALVAASSLSGDVASLDHDIDRMEEEKDELSEMRDKLLEQDRCPMCDLKLSGSRKREVEEGYASKIVARDIKISELWEQINKLNSQKEAKEVACNNIQKEIDSLTHGKQGVEKKLAGVDEKYRELRVAEAGVKMLQRNLKQLEQEKKNIANTESNFAEMIALATETIKTTKVELRKTDKEIKKLDSKLEKLEFWRVGFSNSGIRSQLLDTVVPFLNRVVGKYTDALTDGEATIEFSAQSKLKSGEVREKFKVDVKLAGDSDYTGASGGFKQRVDVAIQLALRDLVMLRARCVPNIAIYDECFEGIDDVGCELIMDLLSEQAEEIGTVFVVTHQKDLADHFTNTWTVVRENDRSEIIMDGTVDSE